MYSKSHYYIAWRNNVSAINKLGERLHKNIQRSNNYGIHM